jgi:hypothetical protein
VSSLLSSLHIFPSCLHTPRLLAFPNPLVSIINTMLSLICFGFVARITILSSICTDLLSLGALRQCHQAGPRSHNQHPILLLCKNEQRYMQMLSSLLWDRTTAYLPRNLVISGEKSPTDKATSRLLFLLLMKSISSFRYHPLRPLYLWDAHPTFKLPNKTILDQILAVR